DGEHEITEFQDNDNLIIKGNNLIALHTLKKRFAGKVSLIYIDPPFNTGNDSFKYNDRFNRSTWLTFMKNRLEVARELLAENGNIFIHIDKNEHHYLKVLMDEIFGEDNFVEEFIWSYGTASGGRSATPKPVNIHDYIIQYAKVYKARKQNKIYTPYSEKYIKDWFKFQDEDGRRYRRRMRGRDSEGNTIWIKQYLDESKGIPLTTIWDDIKQVYADPRAYKANMEHTTELEKAFKGGQKPEKLLKRIIEHATDEGDIVLDFHMGTGTTQVVAHKMNRKYIGIEQMDYLNSITIPRLKKTIEGIQVGISKDVKWQGGGSFVYAELYDLNNNYLMKIQEVATEEQLDLLIKKMEDTAYFNFRVDFEKLKEANKDFQVLSLEEK